MEQVKWRRLARLASNTTNKQVTLTVTTQDFGRNIIAFVSFHERSPEAHIVVNGNRVKSVKMLIKAIAHECAHIVLNETSHTKSHSNTMKSIEESLNKDY